MTTSPPPDRVTAIYDAIDAFQREHRTVGVLALAQYRALLAEHLDRALPAAPVAPAADQAALRQEIRRVLAAADGFDIGQLEPHDYVDQAEAVLSVLPDPAAALPTVLLGAAEVETRPTLNVKPLRAEALVADEVLVDRDELAAVRSRALTEAADAVAADRDNTNPGGGKGAYRRAMNRAEELLRRLAGEQPKDMRCPDAFWTDRPHPPHTWDQGPDRPVRHCPGKSEQPDTKTETRPRCDHCKQPGHSFEDCPHADEPAAGVGQHGAQR